MRASNTLHTSNAAKAQQWIRVVETGRSASHALRHQLDWRTRSRRCSRSGRPHNDCTVAKYLEVLSHELVRYDMATLAREAKRGRVNIYRLGLLMEALQKVRADVGNRTSDSEVDKIDFRAAMYVRFEKDFPPVKKVIKQLKAGTCKIK